MAYIEAVYLYTVKEKKRPPFSHEKGAKNAGRDPPGFPPRLSLLRGQRARGPLETPAVSLPPPGSETAGVVSQMLRVLTVGAGRSSRGRIHRHRCRTSRVWR